MTNVSITIEETLNTEQTIYCKELDVFLKITIVPIGIVDAQIGQFQKQIADSQKTLDALNTLSSARVNPKVL